MRLSALRQSCPYEATHLYRDQRSVPLFFKMARGFFQFAVTLPFVSLSRPTGNCHFRVARLQSPPHPDADPDGPPPRWLHPRPHRGGPAVCGDAGPSQYGRRNATAHDAAGQGGQMTADFNDLKRAEFTPRLFLLLLSPISRCRPLFDSM